MTKRHVERVGRASEGGASLVFVCVALVVLLGVMALAIDLGLLYVSRNEAQRAADAAALAGANQFLVVGCTSASGGCVAGGAQEAAASAQAIAVAAQNYVDVKPAVVTTSDISFNYPSPEEPQITVLVQATVPTFFAKIFGVSSATVDAKATAEAYNPSGGNTPISEGCVVPFFVPNCDSDHPVPASNPAANMYCSGTPGVTAGQTVTCPSGSGTCYPSYFFWPPGSTAGTPGALVNPGSYVSGGVIGETWPLHTEAAPSQWYLIAFTGQSGADLRTYIKECAPVPISCGDTLQSMNGKKVGPTVQGVEARINASGQGLNQGQDSISTTTGPPFPMTVGSNNPDAAILGGVGSTFYGPSQSTAVVPVFSGTLVPGGATVAVMGFMQVFITDVEHSGPDVPVNVVITGTAGCGSSPSPNPIVNSGATPIPIRLIQQPG